MWGALSFHWTVLTNNIIPTRAIEFSTDSNKGAVLGLVTVVGALVSMLTGPIAGVWSDELRSRFGRRHPFLVVGIVLDSIALLALVGSDSLVAFAAAFVAVQFFTNLGSSPYTALIPDQVPDLQKGVATGFAGFAEVIGRLAGAILGGLMISAPAASAWFAQRLPVLPETVRASPMLPLILLVIAVNVVVMLVTVLGVREVNPELPPDRTSGRLLWRAFTFDVRAERDFAWLLLARAMNMLAINTIVTFLLYYVRDYLHVENLAEANAKLGYLFAASAITTLPSSLIAGYFIDRTQRRKIWVYASNVGMTLVCVGFVLVRSFEGAIWVGVAFGVCWGVYFTSDWALALALLPKGDAAAKHLGIWGIAGTCTQVLAPGIGGVLLDRFNRYGENVGYPMLFVTVVIYLAIGTALLVKVNENGNAANVHEPVSG